MVRIFTHRKRTYWGYDRSRVDFKITVDHINFTSNQYFLANSHYVIFRKENKNKQFVSRNKVPTASELKMVHVDEKIKFRACLLQDTAHRYLEKFLPKLKRFVVRQVTETKDEELYVNCGHFELALDIYAMKPSGQDVTVNFVDPSGKASGSVVLKVEHEPRVVMGHYLPNISRSFKQLFTPTHAAKTRISQSRLDHNREKLEFVKKQRMVNHWSHKYDGLSDSESESEAGDTHSASGSSDDGEAKTQKRLPTKSFIMNRTGMPQMSTKGGSSKHHVSAMLRSHMFNFGEEEEGEETPLSIRPQENANRPEEEEENNKVSSVSFYESVTHFEPDDANAKVMSSDTCSTLTHSEQNHLSPRVDPDAVIRRPELEPEIYRKPSVQMMKPTRLNMSAEAPADQEPQEEYIHHSPHGAQVIGHLLPGNTHVPFANQSYKVRASSFLVCESADELSDAGNMPAIELKKEKPLPVVEEELWEDPADFDLLEESNEEEVVLESGSYKPRKSLRHVPPPLISDKSQFIPARSVQRSASMTSASMSTNEANLPRYEPPAAVPQPPRKSLRGAPPPPVPEKESFVPARVVQRANSESTSATIDSREGRESKAAPSAYVPLQGLSNPPLVSHQSEYHTRSTEANKVRSPSPVVRHLVPVRLSAQESANLASHSMSPTSSASMPRQHQHTHHRAASTGDMYAGIGHRHVEDALSPSVSVKELRRNFERPPLVKDNSNGSGDKKFPPLSPKNLPAADPNIKFQRGNSEHSFSTLSTHTELDKPKHHHTRTHSNGAPAKVLVPVRLNSSQQEQAYRAQEAVRSPQSVASLSQAPPQRAPQDKNYGHGYREEPASRTNQVHSEQNDRYQRYHEAQEPNYHHHSNVSPHMHHHSQSQGNMHQAAPHGQAYHPDMHHHSASHNSADAQHTLHRAHTMAPPIRLKANDYVPPVYERYTENHHIHQHIHPGSHPSHSGSGSAYSSPRDGSYTARSMSSTGVSSPPAVYRGVYA
mmetsp:Transcript_62030/g.109182  ORF Transcript_62030/g.109182 Transcript_62030/m.109182 type:complete len:994 (-) Transcript_62030:119-3100(-)